MTKFWKRSRITKAFADASQVESFAEAEALLDSVRLEIVVGDDQIETPAGQAAALTAVATGKKCFGSVNIVAAKDAALVAKLPVGRSVLAAAQWLGARRADAPSPRATHRICIGDVPAAAVWSIACWWNRWLAGMRAFTDDAVGDSRLALAGTFAGALAVRQVFACAVAGRNVLLRDERVSLWSPWTEAKDEETGPERFDVPDKLWLLGLGHLGQAFVWNLCLLGGSGERLAVLQDDQLVAEENEATSLLVSPGGRQLGRKKARAASAWLEASGWRTDIIERRHFGDIALTKDDPPYLVSGLDKVEPRLVLARHGFPYMIDAGIGHGPGDFEGIQIRTIAKGQAIDGLWGAPTAGAASRVEMLQDSPAYRELERHIGRCGTFEFAEASVAVPFVGAATGALTLAHIIRLASLEAVPRLFQIELGAPQMVTSAEMLPLPNVNLGSHEYLLGAARDSASRDAEDEVKRRRSRRPAIHSGGENAG
ncbi:MULTISPECIES: hypothetical protein [Bradyrhizobium]|jgi:hypothetical protein|uniref:hypothetical protein n=1 Tax=Bradyrhizobium TaxID=374 RepID=UPI000480AF15|nr:MULTISPECIES: hypothetical protein [Bradyrhizobium]MCS3452333.1 hypothetical protein [Bradyrhizobium elkanii]MCS3565564.1 hypothetical protein [Bradyrhizobium elkanii]MCW2153704.1 hypothetical protein [Bradyrhizobium elkanii]MCW2356601.1 hypothetical protein [Bradyrhizobium elkanii]MCW2377435.1 hypothetical protein [Bradyrhizobium elkanii]